MTPRIQKRCNLELKISQKNHSNLCHLIIPMASPSFRRGIPASHATGSSALSCSCEASGKHPLRRGTHTSAAKKRRNQDSVLQWGRSGQPERPKTMIPTKWCIKSTSKLSKPLANHDISWPMRGMTYPIFRRILGLDCGPWHEVTVQAVLTPPGLTCQMLATAFTKETGLAVTGWKTTYTYLYYILYT